MKLVRNVSLKKEKAPYRIFRGIPLFYLKLVWGIKTKYPANSEPTDRLSLYLEPKEVGAGGLPGPKAQMSM